MLGAIGILKMRRRTGRFPPARALVAWLAIFVVVRGDGARPEGALLDSDRARAAVPRVPGPRRDEPRRRRAPSTSPRRFARHMALVRRRAARVSFADGAASFRRSAMSVVGNVFGEEPGKRGADSAS